jgi:hypothetical protein
VNTFLHGLKSVLDVSASVLGVAGTLVLAALVLGSFLFLVYMILRFGESGIDMFLPFIREMFGALRREIGKTDNTAIRIELGLECLFGTILVLCLLASLLHALMPWVRASTEELFLDAFITSGVVCVALACVSVTVSIRLPPGDRDRQ